MQLLTKSTGRFREATDVRTIGSFRGASEPGFSDRISSHRLFLGKRFFKPVRLTFRKHGNPFELVRWPRLRRAKSVHYVFSPTIQLTFPFNPVSNVFFETGTDSRFQWLLSEMSTLRSAGETLATNSLVGEFWNSLHQFRDYREGLGPIRQQGALMLLNQAQLAGTLARVTQSRGETSWSAPSPLVFTILHTPQHWTQALNESLYHSGVSPGQVKLLRDSRNSQTEKMSVLLRSTFAPGGMAWAGASLHSSSKTIESVNAIALRQSFFTQLTLAKSRPPQAAAGESFANSSLTFVVSKPFDATRRDQSFGQPTVLSYVKRESPQLQAVVNALHNLRAAQSEMKASSAPQLPSIGQLTSQVRQQLERDLRIEKERRGL